MEDRD
jgi:hypothetical protein